MYTIVTTHYDCKTNAVHTSVYHYDTPERASILFNLSVTAYVNDEKAAQEIINKCCGENRIVKAPAEATYVDPADGNVMSWNITETNLCTVQYRYQSESVFNAVSYAFVDKCAARDFITAEATRLLGTEQLDENHKIRKNNADRLIIECRDAQNQAYTLSWEIMG